MSLYNLVHGVNLSAVCFLPMLGKHPKEYPRFRDCFVGDEDRPEHADRILVLTRTGGGNREDYAEGNNAIRAIPGFVMDYDWDYDTTFAFWVFDVPERWRADFEAIRAGRGADVSDDYRQEVARVYPELADKMEAMFRAESAAPNPEEAK